MSALCLPVRRRVCGLVAVVAIATVGAGACGSSTETALGPSGLPKCSVTLESAPAPLPASGGTASVTVKTARECTWSATASVEWLNITSDSTGQGAGEVRFHAAPNPDPVVRSGAIVANGQRSDVTQAAGECRFELSPGTIGVQPRGGSATVGIQASSALCTWTAASESDWISVRSPSGKGSGAVTLDVAATEGPGRTGSVVIAGQRVTVTQAAGASPMPPPVPEPPAPAPVPPVPPPACSYTFSPDRQAVAAAGGNAAVAVTATPGCTWTAATGESWITITSGSAGTGTGSVTFSVAPNPGPPRTGVLTIAGRPVTITQAAACTFAVSPEALVSPVPGARFDVQVTTGPACTWTASSALPWLSVQPAAGTGTGTVLVAVDVNTGPARSGTVSVAGRTVSVSQESGCTFSVRPDSIRVSNKGDEKSIEVRTMNGCSWTAVSDVTWITVTRGASGTGDGKVEILVARNPSDDRREGTLTVAGQLVKIRQDGD